MTHGDAAMEKYGVHEFTEETKQAADRPLASSLRCPQCQREVEAHGAVRLCPACGSKPFEEVRPP